MSSLQSGTGVNGISPAGAGQTGDTRPSVLELDGITAGYGRTTVLRDVSITVPSGHVVALLGPNGAGKTTLLRVAAGLLPAKAGEVSVAGEVVTRRPPSGRARSGLCMIPEGRGVFPSLSVRDNLLLQVPPWKHSRDVEMALDAFPILRERLSQRAGSMSGGQQQMLALSRCFLADAKVVLLDEVSMGLAPRVIDEIFAALQKLGSLGVSVLMVEQYVSRALAIADHVYLLSRGEVQFSGAPTQLDEAEVARRYLGGSPAPR